MKNIMVIDGAKNCVYDVLRDEEAVNPDGSALR
jgi:hypothetical protein